MPKQMMIFAGLYQNNGTGRDTFIRLYRKGTGRTSEPGAYQGCCGHYHGGITKYSGFTPAMDAGEAIDTKPYSCHKELRPTTSPGSPAGGSLPVPQRKTQWSDGSRRLNYDQLVVGGETSNGVGRPRPLTSRSAALEAPAPVGSENARHHMVVPKDATGPETHQNGPVRQWWTTARMHNVWYVS